MTASIAVIAADPDARARLAAAVAALDALTVTTHSPAEPPSPPPALYMLHLPSASGPEAELFASLQADETTALRPTILVSNLPAYEIESIPHASGLTVAAISEPIDLAALSDTVAFLLG